MKKIRAWSINGHKTATKDPSFEKERAENNVRFQVLLDAVKLIRIVYTNNPLPNCSSLISPVKFRQFDDFKLGTCLKTCPEVY